jgi:hypothetical protein
MCVIMFSVLLLIRTKLKLLDRSYYENVVSIPRAIPKCKNCHKIKEKINLINRSKEQN